MKPRTKLEKEVTWLSSHLLPPSMEQIEDLDKNLFTPKAFYTKKHGYACLECGHRFSGFPGGYKEEVNCPYCGKHLRAEVTRKLKDVEYKSYMLMQAKEHNGHEYFVQRLFCVTKSLRVGQKADLYLERVAEFFTTEGHQVCLGIPITQNGSWAFSQPLTIKKPTANYYGYYGTSYDSYQVFPKYQHIESVPSILERNGFRWEFENSVPQQFVKRLMCEPEFEKLYKMGGIKFANYAEEHILNQYKIANRHHYRIADMSIWVDTIRLLRKLGMDDRNPKHICPDDLHRWHNQLLSRWNRIEERARQARLREQERIRSEEELKRLEREKSICEEYVNRIARFLQLQIQDELINISPIPTVDAVREEGNAMHHCVFAMGYYKRDNVLLLSARDCFGNRVETIEVNLDTYKVAQSRGKYNSNTEHHDRILSLMEQGMSQIREMNTQKINIKAA